MVAVSPHGEISYNPRFRTSNPRSYCLNPQYHNTPKVSSYYSPQELLDIVKVDSLYFLTSSLRTPRNINLTIFLGKNAKNRAFLV